MKKVLLLAAAFYFLLAPLTFHPDNKLVLYWAGQEHGAVWNIWEYGQEHFKNESQFNYPPLHFYLDKVQYFVANTIGGKGFYEWLSSDNSSDPYSPQLARYSFATKSLLMLFGLAVGYLIYAIAQKYKLSEKQSITAACLWLFNPIVIYSIPIMGQNDVMAVLFFLVGWLLLARSKIGAIILFGLSASIKMYPLLWLPFLLLSNHKLSFKEKITIFISSCGVYIATLLPFISNATFREAVLNSDINDRFFIGQIDLGFSDAIVIVPLLLLVGLYAATQLKTTKDSKDLLSKQSLAMMTCNLLLLGFSHFHPQWFTWIIPFWCLWLVQQKPVTFWIASVISALTFGAWLLIVILFQDTYLFQGILVPVNPAVSNIPLLRDLLIGKNIDVLKFNSFAHTWLAAMGLFSLIQLFTKKSSENSEEKNTLSFGIPIFKMPKVVSFILIAVTSIILTFSVVCASYLIPAPRSSSQPSIADYMPITSSVQIPTTAIHNNFNRVELYFRNPNLENSDVFILNILDQNKVSIFEQKFSGFNTGDPSVLRFDIPFQVNSKDQNYVIEIKPENEPVEIAATNLKIGTTTDSTIAVKSYYAPPRDLKTAFLEATAAYASVIQQLPLLYIVIAALLFLAL